MTFEELRGNPEWENMDRSDFSGGRMLMSIRRQALSGKARPFAVWACVRDSDFIIPVDTDLPQSWLERFRRTDSGHEMALDADLDMVPYTVTDEQGSHYMTIFTNKDTVPGKTGNCRKRLVLSFEACVRAMDRWGLDGMIWDLGRENLRIDRETAMCIMDIPSRIRARSVQSVLPEDHHHRCRHLRQVDRMSATVYICGIVRTQSRIGVSYGRLALRRGSDVPRQPYRV